MDRDWSRDDDKLDISEVGSSLTNSIATSMQGVGSWYEVSLTVPLKRTSVMNL